MARIVKTKKKRRSFQLQNFAAMLFLFSGMLYLASSLFLRSYNNRLSTQKQSIENQIAAIEIQNKATEVEIAKLSSADRIDEVAASNGLTVNQENISMITDGSAANGD